MKVVEAWRASPSRKNMGELKWRNETCLERKQMPNAAKKESMKRQKETGQPQTEMSQCPWGSDGEGCLKDTLHRRSLHRHELEGVTGWKAEGDERMPSHLYIHGWHGFSSHLELKRGQKGRNWERNELLWDTATHTPHHLRKGSEMSHATYFSKKKGELEGSFQGSVCVWHKATWDMLSH